MTGSRRGPACIGGCRMVDSERNGGIPDARRDGARRVGSGRIALLLGGVTPLALWSAAGAQTVTSAPLAVGQPIDAGSTAGQAPTRPPVTNSPDDGLPKPGLPAVSGPGLNLALAGGSEDGQRAIGGDATVYFPLTFSTGAQVDLGVDATPSSTFGGASANWFWRDPSKGLLGVYGSYAFDRFEGTAPRANSTQAACRLRGSSAGRVAA